MKCHRQHLSKDEPRVRTTHTRSLREKGNWARMEKREVRQGRETKLQARGQAKYLHPSILKLGPMANPIPPLGLSLLNELY